MFGFLKKAFSPLKKKLQSLFASGIDEEKLEALEQIFYEADLGAQVALDLVEKVRKLYRKNPALSVDDILVSVKEQLLQGLFTTKPALHSPHVIFFVGVNGSGKTTSLAKLAYYYKNQGKKVLIAAGDTFRAAAVEQLESWAKRMETDFIRAQMGSDPSGIVFDALSAAKARKIDIVLIDTAGRLQTKTDLMGELEKMKRVSQKKIPDSPHETLLVIDASVGQNAIDQAKTFHRYIPITGIVLTKLDGTAKGGVIFQIQKELNIPIQWIGSGESLKDLEPFDPKLYVEALFT